MAVSAVFAKLGATIGNVYGVSLSWDALVDISKVIATGVGSVAVASLAGTSLLKWFPGINIWVALLIQPPIVAAIAYSAGNTFKNYYRVHITEGRDQTLEQIKEIAMSHLRSKSLNNLAFGSLKFRSPTSLRSWRSERHTLTSNRDFGANWTFTLSLLFETNGLSFITIRTKSPH